MKAILIKILCLAILLPISPIFLSSCATVPTTVTPVVTAQEDATKTVEALGQVLAAASNSIVDARHAGLLTKDQYNHAVDIYNQAINSYIVLNLALQSALKISDDPKNVKVYKDAMVQFLSDKGLLDSILAVVRGGA